MESNLFAASYGHQAHKKSPKIIFVSFQSQAHKTVASKEACLIIDKVIVNLLQQLYHYIIKAVFSIFNRRKKVPQNAT